MVCPREVVMSQPRDPEFPLFVEDEHLEVRGRDGAVVRLPLAGDRAVVALADYRYRYSEQPNERKEETDTSWTWGDADDTEVPHSWDDVTSTSERTDGPLSHQVGRAKTASRQRSWALVFESGTVALDRNGSALLRMRPLRGSRKVRRVAASAGLNFLDEKVTDPERLGQAPEVVTRPLLGKGAKRMISAISLVLAVLPALAVFAAVDADGNKVFFGLFTLAFARILFHWPLRWIGEKMASG
jgi:hypothetical protein